MVQFYREFCKELFLLSLQMLTYCGNDELDNSLNCGYYVATSELVIGLDPLLK